MSEKVYIIGIGMDGKNTLTAEAAEKISAPCKGFGNALKADGLSVIAEVKKASPSKGLISKNFDPVGTAVQYEAAGAAAVSCLTEEHYFMGSSDYFRAVREKINLPMIRKDFIIDPYQIYEARTMGADAVLLIAALLDTHTISEYRKTAESLGMDVLAVYAQGMRKGQRKRHKG